MAETKKTATKTVKKAAPAKKTVAKAAVVETPKLKDAQWNGSLILTNDDEVSNFSPTNYIVTKDKFNRQKKVFPPIPKPACRLNYNDCNVHNNNCLVFQKFLCVYFR